LKHALGGPELHLNVMLLQVVLGDALHPVNVVLGGVPAGEGVGNSRELVRGGSRTGTHLVMISL